MIEFITHCCVTSVSVIISFSFQELGILDNDMVCSSTVPVRGYFCCDSNSTFIMFNLYLKGMPQVHNS